MTAGGVLQTKYSVFYWRPRKMRVLKQPRAKVTRDKVVAEASRLFALKGYHDTKLEEVLKAAGVTTGAFFHHFEGKEELAFAVIERHMAAAAGAARPDREVASAGRCRRGAGAGLAPAGCDCRDGPPA